MINRRFFFTFALTALLTISGFAHAQDGQVTDRDRILGNPDAAITVIEYASLTCPHCAKFHATVYKELKKNWIDTGKIRFVYRHMPFDKLATAGAIAAESLTDTNRFFGLIAYLLQTQDNWARAKDPLAEMKKLVALAGISDKQFDDALKNRTLIDQVITQAREGAVAFGVDSTPSFVINGKLYSNMSYEDFNRILEDLS